uniref:ABC transporter permease n=1 Tax=Rhodogorgon sp. TaxID=2485824 RepID=A0A3G3MI75_9FLOR|nr:hypothetical protein [Rhodogorgon sp.]
MLLLNITLSNWLARIKVACGISIQSIVNLNFFCVNFYHVIEQMIIVGPGSLTIALLTSCFVGMVFTLQVAKEFLYLNATSTVGAILTFAFVRELCPVLTSIIVAGRVGSSFTAEIATMKVTDQIDALYLLKTDPLLYLVIPRLIACVSMLPILNILSLITSLASSIFVCFIFYNINPSVFLISSFSALSLLDIVKSSVKTMLFGFMFSNISCSWGLTTTGGSKGIGQSTTSSVVTSLLMIFVIDFILSYLMFNHVDSAIKSL